MFRLPAFAALSATLALAQQQYSEGLPIPRSLTPAEAAWLQNHPLRAGLPDLPAPPPTGPLHCAAEYEPNDGLVVAWEGSSGHLGVLQQVALHATTVGQARIWCYVDTVSERTTAQNTLTAIGCDMSRVEFLVRTTDTIWTRDYGPRYVFEGDCRVIVDHVYNRPRPNDDTVPLHFGAHKGHRVYALPLVHGGGNFHLDALGSGHATLLIANENPGLTQSQIRDLWRDYQNLDVTLHTPFPTSVDGTQHVDMWMQVFGDRQVMLSDWPLQPGSVQDQICDGAAASLAATGWAVHRIPACSVSGVHYTFTNMVLCNDLALVPSYTNSTAANYNAPALAAWQAALPGKTVLAVPCQAIVTAAGVMHCIVMHVPKHRGGQAPTAHVQAPNGGQTLLPNQTVTIEWLADDDVMVTGIDLQLSANGGASFPYTLAANLPHTGSWTWTVPDLCIAHARLRVVARDAQGRTGGDASDADFAIAGTGCRAEALVYGAGKPGQFGVPGLGAGTPVLGAVFAVQLQQALPSAVFLLLLGDQVAAVPFDGGTILNNASSGLVGTTDPAGSWVLQVPLPDEPALCGAVVYAQAWVPGDPGAAGAGWAASNGLRIALGH